MSNMKIDENFVVFLVAIGFLVWFTLWSIGYCFRKLKERRARKERERLVRKWDGKSEPGRSWSFKRVVSKLAIGASLLAFGTAFVERHVCEIPRPSDEHPAAQATVDFWHEHSGLICDVLDFVEHFARDRDY
ncbi:MAG: hypothetical protein IJU03_13055 [Thermoguttaceae bacterium]|nr:hypothetical protein [Thermoguttaceae bacterium]